MSEKRILSVLFLLFLYLPICVSGPVTALTFTPDGKGIWYTDHGHLWSLSVEPLSGKRVNRVMELNTGWDQISDCRFDPSGAFFVVGGGVPGESGGVKLFRREDKTLISDIPLGKDMITSMCWSPSGHQLAVSGYDSRLLVLGRGDDGQLIEEPVRVFEGHARAVLGVEYSPDQALIASAGADRSMKIWDTQSGELVRTLSNHTGIIYDISFRPLRMFNGRPLPVYCATASDDLTVRVWQPGIGRMVRIIRHHGAAIFAVAWHPNGRRLYSAGEEGVVRVLDGDSDRVLYQWQAHEDWIYELAMDSEGKRLATGSWNGEVKVWDINEVKARELKH